MADAHQRIAQAVDTLLEVPGTFGVPGTGLARRAVGDKGGGGTIITGGRNGAKPDSPTQRRE